jgi:hypothetical protein
MTSWGLGFSAPDGGVDWSPHPSKKSLLYPTWIFTMFKHLIKIFILGMGLCCLTPAFATSCLTSARLLQNGAPVSSLSVVGGPSTLNLTLEINFDTLGAIGLSADVANPVGHSIGDFCSITHGVVNGVITQGTVVTNSDYLRITFGTPSITRSNFDFCRHMAI